MTNIEKTIGLAVFAVIFNQDGDILMVNHKATAKRPKEYEKWWSMPGGSVEYGETLVEALKREVKEEVNVDLDSIELINYDDDVRADAHWTTLNFSALTTDSGENMEPEKLKAIRWFKQSELPDNLSPYAIRCLKKLEILK
jgi:ADP-ribose pyrophosphatase